MKLSTVTNNFLVDTGVEVEVLQPHDSGGPT